ncbi:CFI-box-CTERM domain-containing protein [Syntrophotalea acetylenica]|uniref:Uncharacterized protein n=1 Tax=Syntrophotalea acetylenica TaxID=29542 RepID=A0A1L3GJ39_SYNAC|nr:CFI-box-CTERM domain-containing protein [Syntrophotalea acetylenica]APG25953.1 hypothetical protein A7E75_13765 [Syntrophotalea acetylenica]APG44021.1 hypothetical protein A6070_07790 [Syntrophotalea acetylenica]
MVQGFRKTETINEEEKKIADGEFLKSITTKTKDELRVYFEKKYEYYKNKSKCTFGFGPEGSCEFIGAFFLADFDETTRESIEKIIIEVFNGNITPLDFSNQMDNIVTNSKIRYDTWSSAFRFIKSGTGVWIDSHACAIMANTITGKDLNNKINSNNDNKNINTKNENDECFIATAAFGDFNNEYVVKFRKYRDRVLVNRLLGRIFIYSYYKVSPPFARIIGKHEFLKNFTRKILLKISQHLS